MDVIAHELAHSWSGNLVTNASWEHFWLNEGWTVYLERRVCAIGWISVVPLTNKADDKFTDFGCNVCDRAYL